MRLEFVGKCLLLKENEKRILAVGDLHLGYEEALNRDGYFVARQLYKDVIKYFDEVFVKIGKVDEIVLLGDVKHEFGRIINQEWEEIINLWGYLKDKCDKIIIVKGNHDKIIGPLADKKNIEVLDFYIWGDLIFMHGDRSFSQAFDKKIRGWVVGHGHPAIKITDGTKVEKYKCFLVGKFKGKDIVVVPSFFEANLGSDPRENELGLAWEFQLGKFDVCIVGDNLKVLNFGRLNKLR